MTDDIPTVFAAYPYAFLDHVTSPLSHDPSCRSIFLEVDFRGLSGTAQGPQAGYPL